MGSSLSCCSDEKVEEGCLNLITLESAYFLYVLLFCARSSLFVCAIYAGFHHQWMVPGESSPTKS